MIVKIVLFILNTFGWTQFTNPLLWLVAFIIYSFPLYFFLIWILSIIFYMQFADIRPDLHSNSLRQYKLAFGDYYRFYTRILRHPHQPVDRYRLGIHFLQLLVIGLYFLYFPFTKNLTGLEIKRPLFLTGVILIIQPLTILALTIRAIDKEELLSILRLALRLFLTIIPFLLILLSLLLRNDMLRSHLLVSSQTGYLGRFVPRWQLFSDPLGLLEGLLFFITIVIASKIYEYHNRPIPTKFSPALCGARLATETILAHFNRHLFDTVLIATFILVYLGGYLNPLRNSNPSPEPGLIWLLIKFIIINYLRLILKRWIPALGDEQHLQLQLKWMIPAAMILVIISILVT